MSPNRQRTPRTRSATARPLAAAAILTLAGASTALAQTRDWNAGVADWTNPANWTPADVPDTAGEIARVLNGGSAFMDGNFTIGGFETSAASSIVLQNARIAAVAGNSVNHGLFLLNGTSLSTRMRFSADTTLSGTGEVRLAGGVNTSVNIIDAPAVSANVTLTNGADHTIRGLNIGSLGATRLAVSNLGLITADGANGAGQLLIDVRNSSGVQFTNAGTLRAENGSTLTLTGSGGGEFDNTIGIIEALDGSIVEFITGADVFGGTYRTGGSGSIDVSSATLNDFDNEGLMRVRNAGLMETFGVVNNSGEIRLVGTNLSTNVRLVGDTTFQGPGSIEFVGGVNTSTNGIQSFSGTANLTVTNTGGHTIRVRDFGAIGRASANIVNESVIVADGPGELLIDPRNANTLVMTNNGTIRSEGGGFITITGSGGGTMDFTGGLVEALNDSIVRFTTNADVIGGIYDTAGSGLISISSADFTDADNQGSMVIENAGLLDIIGSFTNDGLLTLAGTNLSTNLTMLTDADLAGTGEVVLSGGINTSTNKITAPGVTADVTLTIGADQTVRVLDAGAIGSSLLAVVNNGLVVGDGSGAEALQNLLIDPRNSAGVQFTNNGELRAENGSTVTLTGSGNGDFDNTLGVIRAADASQVLLQSSATINGGWIDSIGTGQITSAGAVMTDVTSTADVVSSNGTILNLNGVYENHGTITQAGTNLQTPIRSTSGVLFSGNGEVLLEGGVNTSTNIIGALGVAADTTFTNGPDHTIRVRDFGAIGAATANIVNDGAILADGPGQLRIDPRNAAGTNFTNNGTVASINGGELLFTSSGGGDFANFGEIRAAANSLLTYNGSAFNNDGDIVIEPTAEFRFTSASGTLVNNAGATLFGGGLLDGELDNQGLLEVGDAPGAVGQLTITDDADIAGETVIDVTGSNDLIQADAALSLSGRLRIVLAGYTPTPGEEFVIVSSASPYAGNFERLVSDGAGSFVIDYDANEVVARWIDVDQCGADANGDGRTNADDLLAVLGQFGQAVPADTGGDVTADGLVNADDLLAVLGTFGACSSN